MGGLVEQHVVNWRNRSWSLTGQVEIPDGGAEGVLLNLGGHGGGWSFYLKDGTPTYCYNLFGLDRTHIRGERAGPPRRAPAARRVRLRRRRARQGRRRHPLRRRRPRSATGRVERTEAIGFGYEYTDVGRDDLSPVTDDYPAGDNAFTGTIKWIELEAGDDSHDHLIDPQDFIRVAMWRQ